jgi:regulator of protease activity HflC (stomatin/prohibitin superfamily)
MKRNIYIALAIMLCSWSLAYAQDQKFAIAAKQNAMALQQYTWKSQTQIRKEGDVKATKLYSNRYAADGTVVQLLLQEESAKLPKFGIRGMVAKKKKAEAQELVEALQRFAKSYGELPPAKMQEFMKTANATLETNAAEPLLRLESTNILQPGDSMIVWLDANTRRQRRVEINSTFDEKPVRIVTEFRDLPNGPTYVARSVVDYPREELTLTMENFDYEHLGREEELNLQG